MPMNNQEGWIPPRCGLTDVQKGDLSRLMSLSTTSSLFDQNQENNNDDDSFIINNMIPRLVSFWMYVLDQQRSDDSNGILSHELMMCLESIQTLIPSRTKSIRRSRSEQARTVIWLNHTNITQELDNFETNKLINRHSNYSSHDAQAQQTYSSQNNDSAKTSFFKAQYVKTHSYGSFLYHRPISAIRSMELALQLTHITLNRRIHRLSQRQQRQQQQYENIPSVIVRWHHVYPTVCMTDIKTSIAYKFVNIVGHVVKARPKKLRVVSADIHCLKCGAVQSVSQIHQFQNRCNNQEFNCRNQSLFQVVKSTAKYIDIQDLQIQESFNHNSNSQKDNAGRTPRQIQVKVAQDLVDMCQAGDLVHIAGIIQANKSNTTSSSKRRGYGSNKAIESTSTYKLCMVANSIVVNSSTQEKSADSSGNNQQQRKNKQDILSFSVDQLKVINKIAHADHMMGPLKSVRMAFPFDLLVRSLCPSIIGHDMVKAGILLVLLGGTPPEKSSSFAANTIRSNSHILIVGDPGMGKSQMLLAANQVAARSVFVGGNTSTTTGLTVSLSSAKDGEEAGIEAGALVLADQGVCCIDEFDKMSKTNRDGLLEALEQQQISIAKAGVVASLPARCSIIAAANPKSGNYNINKSVAVNLSMEAPILSRFDLVFILRDEANKEQDRMVSSNIMNVYRQRKRDGKSEFSQDMIRKRESNFQVSISKSPNSQQEGDSNRISLKERLLWITDTQQPLPASALRDYISYAREHCKPKMTQEAAAVLKDYYLGLRYPENGNFNDSVPITTRQLEALIRLSQARAKACLRPFVLKEDAEDVIELMKVSVDQVHTDEFGIDRTRGGVSGVSNRKFRNSLFAELKKYQNKHNTDYIEKETINEMAHVLKLPLGRNIDDVIEGLREDGLLFQTGSRSTYKIINGN